MPEDLSTLFCFFIVSVVCVTDVHSSHPQTGAELHWMLYKGKKELGHALQI